MADETVTLRVADVRSIALECVGAGMQARDVESPSAREVVALDSVRRILRYRGVDLPVDHGQHGYLSRLGLGREETMRAVRQGSRRLLVSDEGDAAQTRPSRTIEVHAPEERTILGRHSIPVDGPVDWRKRAVAHAQALASMFAVSKPKDGTFGKQWNEEAHETLDRAYKEREEGRPGGPDESVNERVRHEARRVLGYVSTAGGGDADRLTPAGTRHLALLGVGLASVVFGGEPRPWAEEPDVDQAYEGRDDAPLPVRALELSRSILELAEVKAEIGGNAYRKAVNRIASLGRQLAEVVAQGHPVDTDAGKIAGARALVEAVLADQNQAATSGGVLERVARTLRHLEERAHEVPRSRPDTLERSLGLEEQQRPTQEAS